MPIDPSLPTTNINNLEQLKFTTNSGGDVLVRTSATGSITPSGLNIGGKVTEVIINDSGWTRLPATSLADCNQISIQNPSSTEIKINYDNTVVGYEGVIVYPNGGERQYLIKSNSIPIYAKSFSGNVTLNIEEIA